MFATALGTSAHLSKHSTPIIPDRIHVPPSPLHIYPNGFSSVIFSHEQTTVLWPCTILNLQFVTVVTRMHFAVAVEFPWWRCRNEHTQEKEIEDVAGETSVLLINYEKCMQMPLSVWKFGYGTKDQQWNVCTLCISHCE